MTDQQIQQWEVERDIARQSGDPELVQKAYDHRDQLMMTCIAHQSTRVKSLQSDVASLQSDVTKIKKDLEPCQAAERDYRENKLRAEGAVWFWRILRYLAAAGGGAFILRILTAQAS